MLTEMHISMKNDIFQNKKNEKVTLFYISVKIFNCYLN